MPRREKILIIRLAAIGDVVMASSLARRLRDAKPEAHITWMCGQAATPLVERFADVDDIITIDDRKLFTSGSIGRMGVLLPTWSRIGPELSGEYIVVHLTLNPEHEITVEQRAADRLQRHPRH